jgi:hypothetical protein
MRRSLFSEDNLNRENEEGIENKDKPKFTKHMCNKGNDCFFLQKGTCNFKHTEVSLYYVIKKKNREISQLENILKNSLLPQFQSLSLNLKDFILHLNEVSDNSLKNIYSFDFKKSQELIDSVNKITIYFKDTTLQTFNFILNLLDNLYAKTKSISTVLKVIFDDIQVAAIFNHEDKDSKPTHEEFVEFSYNWKIDEETTKMFLDDKAEFEEIVKSFEEFIEKL